MVFKEFGFRMVVNIKRFVICKKYCFMVLCKILFGIFVRFLDFLLIGLMVFEVLWIFSILKRVKRMFRDEINSY